MSTQSIQSLFKSHNGYLTKKQLPDRSMYYQLLQLVEEGIVERVKAGVYYLEDAANNPGMIDVSRIVPGGVLCMYTAWAYYELTVQIPQSFHVAIEKSRKLKLPAFPPITLYYWKKEYHELGVIERKVDGYKLKIYDLEKSVCDAVKFRMKIGMDVMSEVLKNYLKRKDRNLTRLMGYAKKMRLEKVLKTYFEVQL